jgi:large subunit ribosomal protein L25
MAKMNLQARKRTVVGRKVKTLRKEGLLPANIYGKKIKSLSIQVNTDEFLKIFKQAGETNLIDIKLEKEKSKRSVLATNLQKNPVTDLPLHVDFHQVDLTQEVSVAVPVVIIGESSAIKEKGGVLITLLDEIKVEALPQNLPDEFKIDISKLTQFNDSILIKDLKVDKANISIQVDENETIVMVQEPKKEEAEPVIAEEVKEEAESDQETTSEEEDDKNTDANQKEEQQK